MCCLLTEGQILSDQVVFLPVILNTAPTCWTEEKEGELFDCDWHRVQLAFSQHLTKHLLPTPSSFCHYLGSEGKTEGGTGRREVTGNFIIGTLCG